MAKKKKPAPQAKLPRNTVTFNLNGTYAEVLASYTAAQAHLHYWMFCQSPFRVRVRNHIFYTTPISGTFYYAVTYQGRYVVYVIIARLFWLVGFYNEHGYFQMIWEEDRLYMDGPQTELTGFDGNHARISGSDVEQTRLGTKWARKGLTSVSDYRGPTQRTPEGFRSGIGRAVTLTMESKYREIMRRCSGSIGGNFSYNRLGGEGASYLVHHWHSKSKDLLLKLDEGHDSEEDIEDTIKMLNELSLLQLDAYNGGMFKHDPLPPLPREDTWEPIDNGTGDPLVGRPQGRRERFGAAPASHRNAVRNTTQRVQKKPSGLRGGGAGGTAEAPSWFVDWFQGHDDKESCNLVVKEARAMGLIILEAELSVKEKVQSHRSTNNDDKNCAEDKNQSKIPPVSNKHKDSEEDMEDCKAPPGSNSDGNAIGDDKNQITALLGSNNTSNGSEQKADSEEDMKDSKAPPGSSSDGNESGDDKNHIKALLGSSNTGNGSEQNAENPPISSSSKTSAHKNRLESDLEELQGPNFIGDENINRFFKHLSGSFGGDGLIEFVNVNSSHLLAHGGADVSLDFDLRSPMFTLFPVNDNENYEYGQGEGLHWSLLVFDASSYPPRCVHLDSLGGANSRAARRLADRICQVVPDTQEGILEAATPRQRNGWDCGIFVMAMARSIARWWASGDQGDWMGRILSEVNPQSVSILRLQLAEILLGNMSFAELEEK